MQIFMTKNKLAPETVGFRVLCPTRWTVRVLTLQTILDNYEVILMLSEESKESSNETDESWNNWSIISNPYIWIYGISLGSLILHHSDNLSKTLQHRSMTAAEGQRLAKLTVDVLKSIGQPDRFQAFY